MDTPEHWDGLDGLKIELNTESPTAEVLHGTLLPLLNYLQDDGWALAQLDSRLHDASDDHGAVTMYFTREPEERRKKG